MKTIYRVGALALAAALVSTASPAAAQLGQLGRLIPGGSGNAAAAADPDAFLAETLESTKLMMISAHVLARAAATDTERDAMRAEIAAIQSMSSLDEVNARQADFDADLEAASKNFGSAEEAQAAYDNASRQQQELLLSAAFNFSLAMLRNTRLADQAPDLIQNLGRNPTMLRKLGSLRSAAGLLGKQVQAVRSMGGPLRVILSKGGVEAPTDAATTEPRSVPI